MLESWQDEHDQRNRDQREEGHCSDNQREYDVEVTKPKDFEDDKAEDDVFECDHDVVVDEIGDVAHKLILMFPEEPKLLSSCGITLDSHDEDADKCSNWEDGIWCQRKQLHNVA